MTTTPDEHHRLRRIMGPANGALVAACVAVAAPVWGIPAWAPLLPGLAGAAVRVWRAHHQDDHTRTVVYRAACWAVPAVWACLAIAGLPVYLAIGVLVGWVAVVEGAAEVCDPAPIVLPAMSPEQVASATEIRTPETVAWKPRIDNHAKITAPGVKFHAQDPWPNDSGFTLHGTFPPESGHTFAEIRDVAPKLGSAGGLPTGCLVQADEGDRGQASFRVEVPTKDFLVQPVPYHGDTTPKSVMNGLRALRRQNSEWLRLYLREQSALIVGWKGAGKTTLIQDLAAELCTCIDSLTWMIDLNRGAVGLPLITPYVLGQARTPGIDWLATTPEECLIMAEIGYQLALYRKDAYEGVKYEQDVSLLPISRKIPMVNIFVDEGAEFGGDDAAKGLSEDDRKMLLEARALLMKTLRIGRDAGINVHFTGLRGVVAMLPSEVLSQSALRIAMKCKAEDEIAYVLGWEARLQPRFLHAKGMCYVRQDVDGDTPPDRVRAMGISRHQLAQVVVATQDIRCTLDQDGLDIGGKLYAQRWHRNEELLDRLARGLGRDGWRAPDVSTVTVVDFGGAVALTERPTDTPSPGNDGGDDPDRAALRDQAAELERASDAEFNAMIRAAGLVVTAESTGGGGDDGASEQAARRAAVFDILRSTGGSVRFGTLLEALFAGGWHASRDTVLEDLNYLIEVPKTVERIRKGFYRAL